MSPSDKRLAPTHSTRATIAKAAGVSTGQVGTGTDALAFVGSMHLSPSYANLRTLDPSPPASADQMRAHPGPKGILSSSVSSVTLVTLVTLVTSRQSWHSLGTPATV